MTGGNGRTEKEGMPGWAAGREGRSADEAFERGGKVMLRLKDVLAEKGTEVWSVKPKSTVFEALKLMAEKNAGSVLVVESDKIVGIFTERDYSRKGILAGKLSRETMVEDLMTRNVYSMEPCDPIDECMALMSKVHCRHMPVLEEGKLAGLVSMEDVVKALIRDQQVQIRNLQSYITGM